MVLTSDQDVEPFRQLLLGGVTHVCCLDGGRNTVLTKVNTVQTKEITVLTKERLTQNLRD